MYVCLLRVNRGGKNERKELFNFVYNNDGSKEMGIEKFNGV